MISNAVLIMLSIFAFLPPILPVFFAYLLPKCIILFARRSTILTSAFFRRWCSCLPNVTGMTAGFRLMTDLRPGSFILISLISHLWNSWMFTCSLPLIFSASPFAHAQAHSRRHREDER